MSGRVWFAGQWRTPEGARRKREAQKRWMRSSAGRACHTRFNSSSKGLARRTRHKEKMWTT